MATRGNRGVVTELPDFDRLGSVLSEAKVKNSDNPLYQVVKTLVTGAGNIKGLLDKKINTGDKIPANLLDGRVTLDNGGAIAGNYDPGPIILIANAGGAGVDDLYFTRIGNYVTVFGKIQVTPNAIGLDTQFGITLPFLSYFDFDYNCSGTAACPTNNQSGAIIADVINKRALLKFLSIDNSTFDMFMIFGYRVMAQ